MNGRWSFEKVEGTFQRLRRFRPGMNHTSGLGSAISVATEHAFRDYGSTATKMHSQGRRWRAL